MKQQVSIEKGVQNTGVMDFSYLLDAPAGKHGFVKVRKGHLYFEDGTSARFIGFNFPTRANMPDHETADRISQRLATMGVNVVRLHAADALPGDYGWSANPEYPLINYKSGNSRTLNSAGVERFDYWVSRLIEKGIYLHVDLLVARAFLEGDNLDYQESLYATKSSSHLNNTLIELQKEYATNLLCHINPYTGKALINDPAVMTIQITNEDSIFFDVEQRRNTSGVAKYREEMQRRFNTFLLTKYGSAEQLRKAWTRNGVCELEEGENPELLTVQCSEIGDYHQPMSVPPGNKGAARYADFTEFGIQVNRNYYQQMIRYIRSLGAKVPIATSCLLTGAADIYSHADGDVMENNAYFNHPAPCEDRKKIFVPFLREYVVSDPRKQTYPAFEPRSNLTVQASCGALEGKPFLLSEWNEYGEAPFHSSSFLMTVSYACLNDWDALIIYCYHTCDNHKLQKADEIRDIMDSWNDPSLIYQFGVMASIFLKRLVKSAVNSFNLVYKKSDLLTQNPYHRMPHSILPLLGKMRTVFVEQGEKYEGNADVAVSAGFTSGIDLTEAKHAIIYEHSPYMDAFGRNINSLSIKEFYPDTNVRGSDQTALLGDKYLIFPNIKSITKDNDYTVFAEWVDRALKRWGILDNKRKITDKEKIISDTGELFFDPKEKNFVVQTRTCRVFSGYTEAVNRKIMMSQRFCLYCKNEKITCSLLALDNQDLEESEHLLLTAVGISGMDKTSYEKHRDEIISIKLEGKLYLDTLEGELKVIGCGEKNIRIWILDSYGNRMKEINHYEESKCNDTIFIFSGKGACGCYELCFEELDDQVLRY